MPVLDKVSKMSGSVSRRFINSFSNPRSHFRHLRPVLTGLESGSNGGNGGKPLRGTNTDDCVAELVAISAFSGDPFGGSVAISCKTEKTL